MSKVLVMDSDLANKIAAGEVVEKVVSVVKELVENSIDAGATEIKIELTDSGVKEIIVTDNGIGMDENDAVLCFSRHATSKLKTLDDLFNIESLGFRGEALPSIASVSNTTLQTFNGEVGTEVVVKGGTIESVRNLEFPQGTKISVKNLFYNTPVRLKYLKNLYVELGNVVEYIDKMALSYPGIIFNLLNNGKSILYTDGSGNLLKTISRVYGIDVAKKMIQISGDNEDYKIEGYISYPEKARSNRNSITTFVNNRLIKNNELNRIITDSYHTYIPGSKYPIVVLNIEVDPILIDINIHPTKMDIKFSKLDSLKELLSSLITKQLENRNLVPTVESRTHEDKVMPLPIVNEVVIEEKEEDIDNNYSNLEEMRLDFEVNDGVEPLIDGSGLQAQINKIDIIDEEPVIEEKKERIKKMYPVGLVHGTYIIAENEDGMYLIDQHAAAERINYEKYLKKMGTHDDHMQDLLIPLKIELTNQEFIILKEKMSKLLELNFEVEEFGFNTILIRSHPYWLPEYCLEEAIRKIIDIIISEKEFDPYKFTEKVAITLACKMSIKANDHLEMPAIEDLLERLRNTENPFTCPHGRPTIIAYSKYELEKLFMRSMEK